MDNYLSSTLMYPRNVEPRSIHFRGAHIRRRDGEHPKDFALGGLYIEAQHANVALGV